MRVSKVLFFLFLALQSISMVNARVILGMCTMEFIQGGRPNGPGENRIVERKTFKFNSDNRDQDLFIYDSETFIPFSPMRISYQVSLRENFYGFEQVMLQSQKSFESEYSPLSSTSYHFNMGNKNFDNSIDLSVFTKFDSEGNREFEYRIKCHITRAELDPNEASSLEIVSPHALVTEIDNRNRDMSAQGSAEIKSTLRNAGQKQ